MDLFELLGKITIENSDALKALDDTTNRGQQTQSKLSSFFSGVGKGAVAVGKTVMSGLAVGGAAMGALTVKALNLGGELEQNMGGSEAVFGKHAGKMQETAKTAFSNMGLSTSDFLATANKMGALFQGAGFDIEESSDIASSAMQRAADVASIMGIDTSAAMEAIAGAAKGNFTMMDNLGVAMNDTSLNAYALEKGINKTTQEMTQQEKIALAMQMFMDKTAYAAGNYAKENQTLAGSLGTAKAALTNFLDGSGDVGQLVDAFSNAANVIIKNVSEIAPRLVSGITDIINQVIPMLPPLLNQLLPVIVEGAVSLINGLVAALPSIINALMSALPALIQGVQSIINALIQALPQIMQSLVSALPTLIPLLVNALVSMIVTLCTMLPQIIEPIINYLPAIIISIVNALMQNLPALIDGLIQLTIGIVNALPQIIQGLVEALPQVIAMIITGLLRLIPQLIQGFIQLFSSAGKAWEQIKASLSQIIPNTFKGIWNAIKNVFAPMSGWFKNIWNNVKNVFTTVGNAIKSTASNTWNGIKNVISNVLNGIKNVATSVWNGIKNTATNVWNGIKNAISTAVNGVKSTVSNVFNTVKSTVSNVFNGIKSTATSVWNGIKSAITKPIEKARDTIKGIVDKIKGFFKFTVSLPKIKLPHFKLSPSGWKIGDLLKGSIPKLGIEWYAKAMDKPMLMNDPTIFGYNSATNSLMGGGEVPGGEIVSGANTLMNMMGEVVESRNNGITQRLDRIVNLLVQFFPDVIDALLNQVMVLEDGTLVAKMAPAMDAELGKIRIKKGKGR